MHGAGLTLADDWWEITSSEQLHALLGSEPRGAVNSLHLPKLNRAHISDLIHYEREAEGREGDG